MRESNFAFPAQNRACVCISSQLYDRRALDTTSPLPLLNSLTHLTYLTSTSPRIREILTCDGGLERLVRLLRDFCLSPPPPENPSAIYGLSPPTLNRIPTVPTLNPKTFDRHAAYRFSLAFQCVVNIGVRGSEPIRSRVVQAGTLDVVGCVLEGWLASKGFAVGPSASASGLPRESREQRALRRRLQTQQREREREHAQEVARLLALERQLANVEEYGDDEDMSELGQDNNHATSDAETSVSTDTSANATPLGSGTPTGSVVVPGRDRSGTVVARPIWDTQPPPQPESFRLSRRRTLRARQPQQDATTSSSSTSRPETETEDDGDQDVDGDIEMSQDQDTDENIPPPPPHPHPHARRAVGIVSDSPPPNGGAGGPSDSLEVDLDAHIIINTTNNEEGMGGVENGIVALDQNVNDDLAMGAPPGAPGAIDGTPRTRTNALAPFTLPRDGRGTGREELTPRAVLAALPMHTPMPVAMPMQTGVGLAQQGVPLPTILRNIQFHTGTTPQDFHPQVGLRVRRGGTHADGLANPNGHAEAGMRHHHHHHRHAQGHHHAHIEQDTGPFREEDVLLSLQLLAYLSKYPHVRQAFYKPRTSFHPATAQLPRSQPFGAAVPRVALASAAATATGGTPGGDPTKKDPGFFKPFATRGKEQGSKTATSGATSAGAAQATNIPPQRMTNVFSLVERFTFRPSPTESTLPQPPPFLPPEIQYWAGVIMRNACRKDESRGGIRQCANMLCGKWESFPREFAKCRRCRKAKYCGKECQSRAWSEGHRFWCSAREGEEGVEGTNHTNGHAGAGGHGGGGDGDGRDSSGGDGAGGGGDGSGTTVGVSAATAARVERRLERERERQRLANAVTTTMDPNSGDIPGGLPRAIANAVRATTAQIHQSALAQSTERSQQRQASTSTIRVAGPHAAMNMNSGRLTVRDRTNAMAGPSNAATALAAALNAAPTARTEIPSLSGAVTVEDTSPSRIPPITTRRRAGTLPALQELHDLSLTVNSLLPYTSHQVLRRSDYRALTPPDVTPGTDPQAILSATGEIDMDGGPPTQDGLGDDMVMG